MPQSAVLMRYAGGAAGAGRRSLLGARQPPVTIQTVVTIPISTEKTATLRVRLT